MSEGGTFTDAEWALVTFAATGERDETLLWWVVTFEMLRNLAQRPDDEIRRTLDEAADEQSQTAEQGHVAACRASASGGSRRLPAARRRRLHDLLLRRLRPGKLPGHPPLGEDDDPVGERQQFGQFA